MLALSQRFERTASEKVDVVRREPDEAVAERDALSARLRHWPIASVHHLLRPEGTDEGVGGARFRDRPLTRKPKPESPDKSAAEQSVITHGVEV